MTHLDNPSIFPSRWQGLMSQIKPITAPPALVQLRTHSAMMTVQQHWTLAVSSLGYVKFDLLGLG
eukprot:m.18586 g.18586  ORF g.18586 m.18586 type:complete len:65 (+) comp10834_c0_seq2:139-333(+)